jgi:tyrosyl-tRNA synthetase
MGNLEEILSRGVEEIIEKDSLIEKLKSRKKLRFKFGVDPTAPDIHLGIAVLLRKLAEFQKLGHKIIFLIGDFTATIGDPSGVNKTRPILTPREIDQNARTYLAQAGKILDIKKTEIRKNSEWYKKMSLADFLKIKSHFTIQRILERDDFSDRLKQGVEIVSYEIDYPVLQAYDSVMLRADIEIGGTDQKFNMLAGRRLMKKMGLPPQDVMTMKILVGTDGKKKMSKSLGNYIGVSEQPFTMYGKIMSIPDELIEPYLLLCTDISLDEVRAIKNPRDRKARLAFEIVQIYHGQKAAQEAEEEFNQIFKESQVPSKIPVTFVKSSKIIDILVETGLASSKSEARRLVEQGGVGVQIKNKRVKIKDINASIPIKENPIIQVGKRRFVRVKK